MSVNDRHEENQTSNISAYIPVYRDREHISGKWKQIKTRRTPPDVGAPSPGLFGDVLTAAGYFGHAQAMTLIWQFVAQAEAVGERYKYEVALEIRNLHYEWKSEVEETQIIHPSKPDEDLSEIYMRAPPSQEPGE
jgi:hypothetical protein